MNKIQLKKLKRKKILSGRIKCHGNKNSCVREVDLPISKHKPLGKKTPKGTKPVRKAKKVYSTKS